MFVLTSSISCYMNRRVSTQKVIVGKFSFLCAPVLLLFFFFSNTSKEMLFTAWWRLKTGKIEKKSMTIVCNFDVCNERKRRETVEVFHCIRKTCFFCLIRHLLIEYDRSFFATIFMIYRNMNRMKFNVGNCNINSSTTSSNSEVR